MPRKGGFTSYIDPDGTSRTVVNGESVLMNDLGFKYEDHLNLLKGESTVRKADRVQRFFPYLDAVRGVQSGYLICTNFKVTFVSSCETQKISRLQDNKLISEDDIPLCNIDSIFLVSKSGKRKPANGGAKISGKKKLEIRCKDFKVVTFSFGMSDREDARQVSTAIVHHAFPTRLDLLFAFEYCKTASAKDSASPVRKYTQLSDWEGELRRLNVRGYKAVMCDTVRSLPDVIVVPSLLNNEQIREAAKQFIGERPPLWSYSHANGSALIRMSPLFPDTMKKDVLERMLDAIAKSHPRQERAAMYDLGKALQSIKDIRHHFEKLKDLCCPAGEQEVWDKETSYMSSLDSTRWLEVVGDCLTVTHDVANDMTGKKYRSVIIQETDSRDLTAVISCLVQLVLDPYARTTPGFQNLIEREWVSLGHRFTDRCGLVRKDNEDCPVFLLFLDCVWQLMRQHPSAFQFSEIYLLRLLDSVNMGLFDDFIFNCHGERRNSLMYHLQTTNSGLTDLNLMSVWDWSTQFDGQALSLNENPLYWSDEDVQTLADNGASLQNGELEHQHHLANKLKRRRVQKLQVRFRPCHIKLWEGCYLRWISPHEIVRGGQIMQFLSQFILRQQISHLQHQIENATKRGAVSTAMLPPPKDIPKFFKKDVTSQRHPLANLTSSFPYISGTTPNPIWYSKSTFLSLRSSLAESTEELDKI